MKLLYKENPRVLVLYSDTHSLVFQQLKRKSSSLAVELLPNEQITRDNGFKNLLSREIHGCLGLINIENQTFLAVVTGAVTNVAHPVDYESVDNIYSVDFISLSNNEWDFANLDSNGIPIMTNGESEENTVDYVRAPHPCIEIKKLLSNGSFYYSNDFDLTSSLQNRGISAEKLKNVNNGDERTFKSGGEHYQTEYMWNSFIMEGLIDFRSNLDPYIQSIVDKNRFLTTVIRGFAKTTKLSPTGDSITIISKQSWKRAGTRFNARGIDDNGAVANFVETEFIYNTQSQSSIFSFTQIRGSVPTFWEQDSTLINPKITLTRSSEATQPIFDKHFADICDKYGVCHIINLLSKTKPAEVSVLKRYRELYEKSDRRVEIDYSEFDFHQETKQLSGGFAGATKILPLLHDSLEQFGWFHYNSSEGEIAIRQNGVFRVNCLDCLDRTNLIQQVISQNVLQNFMSSQGSNGNIFNETARFNDLVNKHNTLWADNGDAISQIYTGTNALKSSFSRSGKMNLAGALSDVTKSVSRMYQNTFVDGKKQSTMEILIGYDTKIAKPVKIHDPINDYVTEQLKENSKSYTSWDDILIFVGTFNINALEPESRNIDLTSWLFPPENLESALPDVFAIGLQELIELNAGSILNADPTKPSKWANLITSQLNSQNEQYLLLRTESMSSMTLLLFVKKSQVHKVTQVTGSSKKTGLGGITANKGACAVRFEFGLTSFALVTSHLAAGTTALVERFNDYSTIMQGLKFARNTTLTDHDHIIWFGDLNYRISLPNDHCRSLIESGAFDELIAVDQLNQEIGQKGAFHGFKEGVVKFYPTYKFDKGTSNYDTSEKQRVPSWTDRVLFKSARDKLALKQLNYNSIMDIFLSDHKPVFATFKSRVEFIDEGKKLRLFKSLYETYKLEHGNQDVSLLELSESASVLDSSSSSSLEKSFSVDALSLLNLLDDELPPSLPKRTGSTNTLPRRVPPPPTSRKAVSDLSAETAHRQAFPRKLPPRPEFNSPVNSAPTPPPSRKVLSQLNETKTPFGFSSTPLIPNRSNSGTPISDSGVPTSSSVTSNSLQPLKPLIPTKPVGLIASKTTKQGLYDENTTANQSLHTRSESSTSSQRSLPVPTNENSSSKQLTMSDWKPLVPK